MPSLTDAFQSFYTYIVSIAGVIALIALIIGGILYLTSTGEPEKLSKARKQILAAFLGIIILLSSYLILRTINPELVSFEMPDLEDIVFHPSDKPASETKIPKLLGEIEEIAEQLKKYIIPGIELSSQKIKGLTDNCDCKNTQPLCYCTGGSSGDSCEPRQCYAGPGFQPCPNESEIKENQKRIIAWKDEIMYYRNRAIAEEEDLHDEITKVIDEKIRYYTQTKAAETDEKIIEYFEEQIADLEKEEDLKEDLGAKLRELIDLIGRIYFPALEIGIFPDNCLINVKDKCSASCKGECHDYENGCEPADCKGGNPCPINDIQTQFDEIQNLNPQISQVCEEILNIIDEIIKHKTIVI